MTMIEKEKAQQNKAPRWILYLKALAMRVADFTRRICQRIHQRLAPQKTVAASETVAKKEMRAVEAPARSGQTWEEVMTSAIHFIKDSYELRFNLLDARPELRAKHETDLTRESLLAKDFCPATPTIINTIVVDLHAHGIRVWDRDVKRLLYSLSLPLYHPFNDYMAGLPEWDGRDRVMELAKRVSENPLWVKGFSIWMRGMVKQWMECMNTGQKASPAIWDGGNQLAPILVSRQQGMHKSSFCRLILPPVLSTYFTDKFDLSGKANHEYPMSRFALINMDEFDRFSSTELVRLKNLMQMRMMMMRRPYSAFFERAARMASFIGTSNTTELLSDPSGARRFLCVEVDHSIDCNTPVEHDQLYAQLVAEITAGMDYYMDKETEAAVEANNRAFYRSSALREAFVSLFDFQSSDADSNPNATGWKWMTATEIFCVLQQKMGQRVLSGSAVQLGKQLMFLDVERKHANNGNAYRVRKKVKKDEDV
mgnify:FL=1